METEELFSKGRECLSKGENLSALGFFERAYHREPGNPSYMSYLGLCIAYERRNLSEALGFCKKALQTEPCSSELYLNLGKVYLDCGRSSEAMDTFRRGMKIDSKNPEIILELQTMGVRRKRVIPVLPRSHFINRYTGLILSRMGFR